MTNRQIEIVKSTWAQVASLDPVVVGGLFYDRLFEIAPYTKPMFQSTPAEQSRKLIAMINYVIIKLDRLGEIIDEVAKLAHRHVKYGVKPQHYTVVGEALIWTLQKGLGQNWNAEVSEAWITCYGILSGAMITASEETSQQAA